MSSESGPQNNNGETKDDKTNGEVKDDKPIEKPTLRESENSFLMSYMSLPTHIRIQIGHNISTFIQSCTFNGDDCTNTR